jgi:hypothetical protein
MEKSRWLLGETPDLLGERIDEIRAELEGKDPHRLAIQTGAIYTSTGEARGEFKLALWNQEINLAFPEFTAKDAQSGEALSTFDQALLAYYFNISDGTPQAGKWIAFSELPDGRFYAQAFQGYTGDELGKVFGNQAEAFVATNERLGGRREFFGNLAFSYAVIPRVSIMVVCWLGDEDFPPSYRILFDAAAGHHLTTDACAILGSQLTRRLIKVKDQ